MKTIPSFALIVLSALSFTGCSSLPTNVLPQARVASLRRKAVPLDQLACVIPYSAMPTEGASFDNYERLFLLTKPRIPQSTNVEPSLRVQSPAVPPLDATTLAAIHSTFATALTNFGFHGVITTNALSPRDPLAPKNRARPNLLGNSSKGALLCVVNVYPTKIEPRFYQWTSFFRAVPRQQLIGSDVTSDMTAHLVDAESGEILWSIAGSVRHLIRGQPTGEEFLQHLAAILSTCLPNPTWGHLRPSATSQQLNANPS